VLISIQHRIATKRGPATCRLHGIATDGGWTKGFKAVAAKMQQGSRIVLGRHKRYDDEAARQAPIMEQLGMEIKAPACSSFNPQMAGNA
jgi:hypothetical protein